MKLKHLCLISSLLACFASSAGAQSIDIIGGPDNSTQTLHHCGLLPATASLYTTSPATIRTIERKLFALGYATQPGNGVYGKQDVAAVKRFQEDNGLKVDGVVGPMTAQHLAYFSHPAGNVHRCFKTAAALR